MNSVKKCSSIKHEKSPAIIYCQDCRLYMCEKCQDYHKQYYAHTLIELNKEKEELFDGICKEENHKNILEYFCKSHNQLCCDSCIVKFKKNGKGIHSNCDIVPIEDVKDEMKNKLNNNIKLLEELSNSLEKSINELKTIFDNINQNKETLKSKIQKSFTKLRNAMNRKEDELLEKVDKKFEDIFFKEEIIKKCEKLPKRVNYSLEKGKLINKEETDNHKLNIFIHDCISLENNIQDIKIINENIKKCKSIKPNVKLYLEEEDINNIIIKSNLLGEIYYKIFDFGINNTNSNNNQNYILSGENNNIITKKSKQSWSSIQSQNPLEKDKKYIWKIKVLNTKNNNILVGVSSKINNDIDMIKKLNLEFAIPIASAEKYIFENPFIAYLRDHKLSEEFNVIPGTTYRIYASAKRICGDINLQGGICYTSYTAGVGWDGVEGKFIEEKRLDNGYIKYYKDVKVPPGKQKGKLYFQIDQPHEGGSTLWLIADISISQINNNKNNDNNNYGYYLYLRNSNFYSDFPFKYRNKKTNIKKIENEVTIVMDVKKRELKYIINNEDKNNNDPLYTNIPIEKPLYPTILLYDENDSICFIDQ